MGKIAQGSGRAGGNGASFPGRGRADRAGLTRAKFRNGIWARGVVAPPFRCSRRGGAPSPPVVPGGDGGCRRIRRVRPMCRPEYVLLREPFTGGYTGPPLRGVEGIPNHPGQRRTAERLRRGCEGMGGDRSRDHPKGTINAGQSLSQPAADSSLYTREPLGTGDADCRVGPAGLLAMTMVFCHSEERSDVGIRPFLRWTMDGGSGCPTKDEGRHAGSSCPTGGRREVSSIAGAALSEAESAERAAGQIRFLPDDLRVQHGAQRSEVSAKLRPCSRRDCLN